MSGSVGESGASEALITFFSSAQLSYYVPGRDVQNAISAGVGDRKKQAAR